MIQSFYCFMVTTQVSKCHSVLDTESRISGELAFIWIPNHSADSPKGESHRVWNDNCKVFKMRECLKLSCILNFELCSIKVYLLSMKKLFVQLVFVIHLCFPLQATQLQWVS